jgi:phosphoribosylamine--glycine ligase
MKVLIIGDGAREHVLARLANRSPAVEEIYCHTVNAGIYNTPKFRPWKAVDPVTIEDFAQFASDNDIGLTIVGPEKLLEQGIVDAFRKRGLSIFGPHEKAARLEGSKSWAKMLMHRANIPTAPAEVCTKPEEAMDALRDHSLPVVIKCDGLAAGKGVKVCYTKIGAIAAVNDFMNKKTMGKAGDTILVEKFLEAAPGIARPELSVMALVDVEGNFIMLPPAQDYKQAFDGDAGDNTGGMGSEAPVAWVTKDHMQAIAKTIIEPILKTLRDAGIIYSGVLYAGLLYTRTGFKVVEFNVRFGDPEIVALFPHFGSDVIPIMKMIVDEESIKDVNMKWLNVRSACVVIADKDYPSGRKDRPMLDSMLEEGPRVKVFCAGAKRGPAGLVSTGGRVVDVVGVGGNMRSATKAAYDHIKLIGLSSDFRYRKDIGVNNPGPNLD